MSAAWRSEPKTAWVIGCPSLVSNSSGSPKAVVVSKKNLTVLAFKFELPYWSSNVFSATEIITSSWYSP